MRQKKSTAVLSAIGLMASEWTSPNWGSIKTNPPRKKSTLFSAIRGRKRKPHQSEKEKQRRRRQMLNGTHGYEMRSIRGKYRA